MRSEVVRSGAGLNSSNFSHFYLRGFQQFIFLRNFNIWRCEVMHKICWFFFVPDNNIRNAPATLTLTFTDFENAVSCWITSDKWEESNYFHKVWCVFNLLYHCMLWWCFTKQTLDDIEIYLKVFSYLIYSTLSNIFQLPIFVKTWLTI